MRTKTYTRTRATVKPKQHPIKNAFTFAQELAIKHNWPTFIFDGEEFTPFRPVNS